MSRKYLEKISLDWAPTESVRVSGCLPQLTANSTVPSLRASGRLDHLLVVGFPDEGSQALESSLRLRGSTAFWEGMTSPGGRPCRDPHARENRVVFAVPYMAVEQEAWVRRGFYPPT